MNEAELVTVLMPGGKARIQWRGEELDGEVVITGTCLKPVDVEPGDHVTVEFPGLGEMKVAFD